MPPPVPESLQRSVEATKVEYVQLGASGLRVSCPILGTSKQTFFLPFAIPVHLFPIIRHQLPIEIESNIQQWELATKPGCLG